MKYEGKLYAHVPPRRYIDTGKTGKDWERLEDAIKGAIAHLEANYDIDGNSMSESDAAVILRKALT